MLRRRTSRTSFRPSRQARFCDHADIPASRFPPSHTHTQSASSQPALFRLSQVHRSQGMEHAYIAWFCKKHVRNIGVKLLRPVIVQAPMLMLARDLTAEVSAGGHARDVRNLQGAWLRDLP